ncbi:TIGR03503 family protein [Lacimicrobium sp. SS2-24]|uniref:TIGR03503 family protein n=1 Tax=Lacimicrobium sp. SS2-24 TaxID=2005569 RepID=UPI000B4B6AF0|nr:TIGR03503 family protein [Lacimicrobium sp. SS2-24]
MRIQQGVFLVLLLAMAPFTFAQQGNEAQDTSAPPPNPITMLSSDQYLNSIELLQNRFRIDYKVDELTLVFFREYGSAPVVLVRPDGSKILPHNSDNNDDIDWYDDTTYDLVRIKKPMPGPWQAVGQLLPGSKVMVVSDIRLQAEPLPELVFSGEVLKLTAYLTNGGKPIEYVEFGNAVELTVEFISTNNPDFTNFGAETELVARYEDNGMGMDEYPMDGTFTGQFNLSIPEGQWKPVYTTTTAMFSREEEGEPLVLLPNPMKLSVDQDQGDGRHRLNIDVDREVVDIESLLVDGKIRYPNGDVLSFSLTEPSDQPRVTEILNIEYGIFRIKMTAYGKTVNGRDFVLDVPEFSFLSEAPLPPEPDAAQGEGAIAENLDLEAQASAELAAQQNPEPAGGEEDTSMENVWFIIGLANLLLVVIGGAMIGFFMLGKGRIRNPLKGRLSFKRKKSDKEDTSGQ